MTRSQPEPVRVHPALLTAHRADEADPADIQRAYLRFSWARRKAAPRLTVARWLVAGVAIGFGVASAATLIPPPRVRTAPPIASAEASAPSAKQRALKRAGQNSAVDAAPAFIEPQPQPLSTSSERPPAPLPPEPAHGTFAVLPQRAPALPSSVAAGSASDWQRAAAALRGGDLKAAEAALAKLEQTGDLRDRQAAELARAQLLVGRGRVAEARPTLQRLAREGSSAVIRSQAADMLENSAR